MPLDGTPTVTEPGETPAPTPSAEPGGADTVADSPESMIDHIGKDLEARFGPAEGDTDEDDFSPEPPEATGTPAPEKAAAEPGSEQPEPDASQTPAANDPAAAADSQGDDGEALPEEVTDAELAAYTPKAGRRVKKLLAERYALRQEVEQTRPVAEFIRTNNLANEDVQMALGLAGALQRGDFKGFLEGIAPMVVAAQQYLGQALPADLQQQVQQGYISQELASQLAASRAQNAWTQSQMQRQTVQQQEAAAATQATQLRNVMAQSVTTWEYQIRQADPDYARKEPTIRRMAQALIMERGRPQTAEAALAIAKDAYAEANKLYLPAATQPTRPAPTVANSGRTGQPTANTLMEAMQQGLARANSR